MESETNFVPKREKPKILYHASSNRNIERFEPRIGKRRDENEGKQIFATPSKAIASVFMIESDDSWVASGDAAGTPFIVISDEARYRALDNGGTIYELPSDTFDTDMEKGLRENEYTSKEPVDPIGGEEYESAIDTMLSLGVAIYFVDKETFHEFQTAPDGGESLLQTLQKYSG